MAQSAFSHRAAIRFSSSILLAAASCSVLLCSCDSATSKSDKDITAKLQQAQAKIAGSTTPPTATNAELDAAAKESTDSLPVQIYAKVSFADSELQLAQTIAADVASNDVQIDRLRREVGLLAGQIQANNQLVDALQKWDPSKAVPQGKSVLDSVNDTKAAITGSDDKPDWVKTDATSIAALAAVDKKAAGFQAEVSRLTDAIKTGTDQRNQLLDQADKLGMQSQHERGDKSVDLYTQGSDDRKKAAELTVQIDTDTAALARNQADLAVQQGQHDSLTAALKLMDDKAKTVNADWKSIQDQIALLNKASLELLGDEPSTPPMMVKGDLTTAAKILPKTSAIHQLGEENRKMRAVAETHFDKAIALYREAGALATRVSSDLRGRAAPLDPNKPERAAWMAQANALDPTTCEFLEADAEMQKASFDLRSASEAKTRLDMITAIKPILAPVFQFDNNRPMPPSLDENSPDLAKQAKDAIGTGELGARGFFAEAIAHLDKIATGTAPLELRSAAKSEQIFAQYAWSTLEAEAGDAQAASLHLEAARTLVSTAQSEGIQLAPMPPDLAPAPPVTPGTPGTPAR